MYAVIETGGKQYRVEVGTELEVELLEAAPGDNITLDRVLLVADGDDSTIGRPVVTNAAVEAEVLRRDRGDKVIAFKYRPKARRRVKKGHRQELTVIRVTDVRLNGRSAAEDKRKADAAAKTERQRLEEAAARQAAEDAALAERLAKTAAKTPAKADSKAPAPRAPRAGGASTAAKGAAAKPARTTTKASTAKASTAKSEPKTPRAKTQSGAADAKPKAAPEKPAPKPRATKKDE